MRASRLLAYTNSFRRRKSGRRLDVHRRSTRYGRGQTGRTICWTSWTIADENSQGDELRSRRCLHREHPQVPAGHAAWQFWKSRTHPDRDADLPAVSGGADRDYSTEIGGRARCSRGRGPARNARDHAGIARTLARLQRHSADDHVSPCLLAPKPGAFGKTQSLGRHAPGVGATRSTNHRATAKLFSVAALYEC